MIGEKDKEVLRKLFPFFSERPVLFDIGSNKGMWSDIIIEEYKMKEDGCEIHLVEPNLMLLNFTRIKYEYQKNIYYNDYAAYNKDGITLPFYYFENYNNELSSLVKQDWWEAELPMKTREVPTITLDSYSELIHANHVDCIKIDCEGGDVDALLGCEGLLKSSNVGFIIIEYGGHYRTAKKTFKEVIEFVAKYGYRVYYYGTRNFREVTLENFVEDYRAEDFIITKKRIVNQSEVWNIEFIINTLGLPKIDFICEYGTFEGITAKYICQNILAEGGRMICVDPLKDYYTLEDTEHKDLFEGQYERFLGNTRGLPIELVRKTTEEAFESLIAFRFGFIYIDADHSEKAVYDDGVRALMTCIEDGYILFDDYTWREETQRGIDKFLSEYAANIKIISKNYQVLIQKIRTQ